MNRKFRLRNRSDLERVRRSGKSYAHPLVVLVVFPNEIDALRVAVVAGRSVGGAVKRNFAKRHIREAVRPFTGSMLSGWDLIFFARHPIGSASFSDIQGAVKYLLHRSGILPKEISTHEPPSPGI